MGIHYMVLISVNQSINTWKVKYMKSEMSSPEGGIMNSFVSLYFFCML